MKKTLSLILAIIMCLSLCACNNSDEPENNTTAAVVDTAKLEAMLVGEWKNTSGSTLTFCEGGLGYAPAGDSFDWSVDAESSQYVISYQGRTFTVSADTDNGARFVFFEGMKFYHADDFEKVSK